MCVNNKSLIHNFVMAAFQDDMKDNYFNVYFCNVCRSKESFRHSKLCSACKLVSYCGSEHQKADQGNHKTFCKAVQNVCRQGIPSPILPLPSSMTSSLPLRLRLPGHDVFDVVLDFYHHMKGRLSVMKGMPHEIRRQKPDEWQEVKMMVIEAIEKHLKRRLKRFEQHMIYHSKYCAVCFTRKNIEKESVCTNCFSVGYCSAEHRRLDKDKHKEVCSDLRKVLDMDLFMLNVNLDSLAIPLLKPDQACDLKLYDCDMKSFIAKYVKLGLKLEEEALFSFYYTSVLTFANYADRIVNFTLGERLTIHIVGAQSSVEDLVLDYWEILLHLFPGVRTVTIVHIGPHIDGPVIKLKLCGDCRGANKSIEALFYKQSYREYHDSLNVMKRPDVIIAFNGGLYASDDTARDSWGPSLPLFFKYDNVPVILTEMAKYEVELDLERLLSKGVVGERKVRVAIECEENPFMNLRLWREWSDPDHKVRTKNSYVCVLIVLERGR